MKPSYSELLIISFGFLSPRIVYKCIINSALKIEMSEMLEPLGT